MAMMDIREVRVRVSNRQMHVWMGMRLVARIRKVVFMLMMLVVAVPMRVLEALMRMLVLMPLSDMEPNAKRH